MGVPVRGWRAVVSALYGMSGAWAAGQPSYGRGRQCKQAPGAVGCPMLALEHSYQGIGQDMHRSGYETHEEHTSFCSSCMWLINCFRAPEPAQQRGRYLEVGRRSVGTVVRVLVLERETLLRPLTEAV